MYAPWRRKVVAIIENALSQADGGNWIDNRVPNTEGNSKSRHFRILYVRNLYAFRVFGREFGRKRCRLVVGFIHRNENLNLVRVRSCSDFKGYATTHSEVATEQQCIGR